MLAPEPAQMGERCGFAPSTKLRFLDDILWHQQNSVPVAMKKKEKCALFPIQHLYLQERDMINGPITFTGIPSGRT